MKSILTLLTILLTAVPLLAGEREDREAQAALALAAASRARTHAAVPDTPSPVTVAPPAEVTGHWSYRAPVGHTHTCVNGHTWDHTANPTHTCQICGAQQVVIDNPSRPVGVWFGPAASVAPPPPYRAPPTTYAPFGSAGGGCSSGNCPAASAPGLLPRLRR